MKKNKHKNSKDKTSSYFLQEEGATGKMLTTRTSVQSDPVRMERKWSMCTADSFKLYGTDGDSQVLYSAQLSRSVPHTVIRAAVWLTQMGHSGPPFHDLCGCQGLHPHLSDSYHLSWLVDNPSLWKLHLRPILHHVLGLHHWYLLEYLEKNNLTYTTVEFIGIHPPSICAL